MARYYFRNLWAALIGSPDYRPDPSRDLVIRLHLDKKDATESLNQFKEAVDAAADAARKLESLGWISQQRITHEHNAHQ